MEKESWLHGQGTGYASTQANWKRKSEFYKKEELEENLIYSFEQIRSTELKNNNIGVSQCKILIAYFSRCPKLRTGHFA